MAMAARVRSGDPENLEAQAAHRYWKLIFGGEKRLRRGAEWAVDGRDQNQHLDYGYTVLRAAVARAVCAAGLHPSLGVRHRNRYDVFCLASDGMEPFRPLIDRRVCQWMREHAVDVPLERTDKAWLIGAVTARYRVQGQARTLFDILMHTAVGLARAMLTGDAEEFAVPTLLAECDEDGVETRR